MPSIVIKVGGSLFDLPDLVQRILKLRQSLPQNSKVLYIAGGGEFCNEVRRLHRRFSLTEETSHQLCLKLMNVTAEFLAGLLQLTLTDSLDEFDRQTGDQVFAGQQWLQQTLLPESWAVSSDSISALVAEKLAAELWLLKSTDEVDYNVEETLDAYFSKASKNVASIQLVNLRSARFK